MTTQLATVEASHANIHKAMFSESTLSNIAAMVPIEVAESPRDRKLAAMRAARIAITQIRRNPELAKCEPQSIIEATCECMALNLRPEGVSGQAYFVPYKGQCQLQIGYRGMLDLARRSGTVIFQPPRVVRTCDEFSFRLGSEPHIEHVPEAKEEKSSAHIVTHAYAVAYEIRFGHKVMLCDVMNRKEIDSVRAKSKARSGPWSVAESTDWCEMAKKSVLRRFLKSLPVSVELQGAISRDEMSERGGMTNSGSKYTEAVGETVIDPDTDARNACLDQIGAWWMKADEMKRSRFNAQWGVIGPQPMASWNVAALENVVAGLED